VWLTWLITRLVVLCLLFGPESPVVSDVIYFTHSMQDVSNVGLAMTMREYPLPAVGTVALPWIMAIFLGSSTLFGPLVVLLGLGIDGLFTAVLTRTSGPGRRFALGVWLAAVPALGGLTYARFDLIPGVLVGCVVLLAGTRPRLTGVCLAVATSIKLWPALLVPTVGLRVSGKRRYYLAIGVIGTVVAGGTLGLAGWGRVVSPLVYQSDRGLQIESVAATPVMAARLVNPAAWSVFYSKFKAFEISGPAVAVIEHIADVASLALVVALCFMWLRAGRGPGQLSSAATVWMCLAAVSGFMAVGKVLSPQYFLWLIPAAAAALTATRNDRRLQRWGLTVVAASVLTHAVYPWLYLDLVLGEGLSLIAVLLLVVRNAMVVWLFVEASRQALRELKHMGDGPGPISTERSVEVTT